MIPPFDADGNLPAGIHRATWPEIIERFGGNRRRDELLDGLFRALQALHQANCQLAYVDGSFVTAKPQPADFDGCWDHAGIDFRRLDPVLFDFEFGRRAQKRKYGGELFPSTFQATPGGTSILNLFQMDKVTRRPKGIIAIDLGELP